MRFSLIDRIAELSPGSSIRATKNVSLAEEYLADHFPQFPVLPGVFMLEAMTQASAWLIRASEEFAHSMVVLHETKNVKYSSFVAPGQTLTVAAELQDQDERYTRLKARGTVDGETRVSARLVLERYDLAERDPTAAATDVLIKQQIQGLFALLYNQSNPLSPEGG